MVGQDVVKEEHPRGSGIVEVVDLDGSRSAGKDAEACAGRVFDGEKDIDPVPVDAVGGLCIGQMMQTDHVIVGMDHPLSEGGIGRFRSGVVGKEFNLKTAIVRLF